MVLMQPQRANDLIGSDRYSVTDSHIQWTPSRLSAWDGADRASAFKVSWKSGSVLSRISPRRLVALNSPRDSWIPPQNLSPNTDIPIRLITRGQMSVLQCHRPNSIYP